MKTNGDITLFTRSIADRTEAWVKSVIKDVLWTDKKAVVLSGGVVIQSDSVNLYISLRDRSIDIKATDVVVKGSITQDITASYTMTDLRDEYTHVVTVRSVSRNDFGNANLHNLEVNCT